MLQGLGFGCWVWGSGFPFKYSYIQLPILLGGAKELGMVYVNIIRGAKEPRNIQNHRGAKL